MAGLPSQVEQAGKRADDLLNQGSGENPPEDPTAPEVKTEPNAEELQKQLDTLNHKYEVLKGKYNKEVKQDYIQSLESQVSQLKQQLQQMNETLQSNQSVINDLSKQAPREQPKDIDVSQVLSDEDKQWLEAEDLGEPFLKVVAKVAQALGGGSDVARQIKDISSKVETVEKRVEETEKESRDSKLLSVIPDFYKINAMPEWDQWLKEPVAPNSYTTRKQDLQTAMNAMDYETVKAAMDLFKTEMGKKETPKPKTPPVEPDESFSGEPPKAGKTYTMVEVKKFYEDQTKGHYVGREKEAAAIDRDIQAAMRDGRIKG